MAQRSAFTLVEVAIAITITIILAGIGIPRYNQLIRTQDFYSEAQEIVSCLQRAQSLASGSQGATLSTGNPIRWSAAKLTESSGTVTCTVMAFDASVSSASLDATVTSVLTSGTNTFTATDVQAGITGVNGIHIFFGALEKGVPVKLVSSSTSIPPLGAGLRFSLNLTSSLDSTTTAQLTMAQLGIPIELVRP
jgi:type II secretory pathway pseudopilin PulG